MTYASHPRTSFAEEPEARPIADPLLAVEALRLAGRAMQMRDAPRDPRDRAIAIIQARLTAVLEAVGAQLDAVESIRTHLKLLEAGESVPNKSAPPSINVRPPTYLPAHWRSRGPRPRNFSARPLRR